MELYWMGTIGFLFFASEEVDVDVLPREVIEKAPENE